jgi:hypothetical protein
MKDINDMTEEQQIKKVRKNPFLIADIKNPSKSLQLEAIKQNKYAIKEIKNPCEEAKILVKIRKL